ncbi:MAG: cellulase family glycosylhydrolase, partial [Candidatus Dormibacteraeota bacterium]|nr:cellulase family glycosylhydrolase [Candidatus Dormibacteraeota bacterium]
MKTIILALAATLIIAMTPLTGVSAATPFLGVSGDNLTYNGSPVVLRGENFNNGPGLSCCNGTDITGINSTQADYTTVAAMGANSVRFGMDYKWYASNRAQFFSVLDTHVAWAAAAHLWLVPVIGVPPGGSDGGYGGQGAFWGSSANQQLLVDFWRDFASHFAGSPTIGGYDVFNEPAPPSAQAWD